MIPRTIEGTAIEMRRLASSKSEVDSCVKTTNSIVAWISRSIIPEKTPRSSLILNLRYPLRTAIADTVMSVTVGARRKIRCPILGVMIRRI